MLCGGVFYEEEFPGGREWTNSVNSGKYALNSLWLFSLKVFQMVLIEMKNVKTIEDSKRNIRQWGMMHSVIVNSTKTTY